MMHSLNIDDDINVRMSLKLGGSVGYLLNLIVLYTIQHIKFK